MPLLVYSPLFLSLFHGQSTAHYFPWGLCCKRSVVTLLDKQMYSSLWSESLKHSKPAQLLACWLGWKVNMFFLHWHCNISLLISSLHIYYSEVHPTLLSSSTCGLITVHDFRAYHDYCGSFKWWREAPSWAPSMCPRQIVDTWVVLHANS